jgi:hypothetical protein
MSSTSRIRDREDRMLAYYINLINQQEQQQGYRRPSSVDGGSTSSKRGRSLSADRMDDFLDAKNEEIFPERSGELETLQAEKPQEEISPEPTVGDTMHSANNTQTSSPAVPTKRPVGRPRKHPPTIDNPKTAESTPKKPRKQLELEEAERIISTILDHRPGRAEFKVHASSPKKPQPSDQTSVMGKKSAKTLAHEEAERIIATIEKRPTNTSTRAISESPQKMIDRAQQVNQRTTKVTQKIKEEEVIIPKRGPGRPPSRSGETVTQPALASQDIPPVKRGPGRPPKSASPTAIEETGVQRSRTSKISSPNHPSVMQPVLTSTSQIELSRTVVHYGGNVETHVREDASSFVSFSFHPTCSAVSWWTKPVGLECIEFEEELQQGLKNICSRANEKRLKIESRMGNDFASKLLVTFQG